MQLSYARAHQCIKSQEYAHNAAVGAATSREAADTLNREDLARQAAQLQRLAAHHYAAARRLMGLVE